MWKKKENENNCISLKLSEYMEQSDESKYSMHSALSF